MNSTQNNPVRIFDQVRARAAKFILAFMPYFRSFYMKVPEKKRLAIKVFLLRIASTNVKKDCMLKEPTLNPSVSLIGYPKAELGMGEHVRLSALAFSTTSFPFSIYDFNQNVLARQNDQRFSNYIDNKPESRINIFHINADQMPIAKKILGDSIFKGRYNIGYWAWELAEFPDAWLPSLDLVDEIWAPSKFIQEAIEKKASCPVIWMPLAVQIHPPSHIDKSYFNIDSDCFMFLFYFDLASFGSRKNPLAVIDAFLQAFQKEKNLHKVTLVIKTMGMDWHKEELKKLESLTSSYHNIILLNKVLSHEEIAGLVNCCDCFVSLHRAEGFGRGLAEAMFLGKPVIATNYSGNMDFTKSDNSLLVDYSLIAIPENDYPHAENQVWAEPDVRQASSYMKRLVEDSELCSSLGSKAQEYICDFHSPAFIGKRYVDRLKVINKEILA